MVVEYVIKYAVVTSLETVCPSVYAHILLIPLQYHCKSSEGFFRIKSDIQCYLHIYWMQTCAYGEIIITSLVSASYSSM